MASSVTRINMSQLLGAELGVDFEIRCPGYVFEVHSSVLVAQSSFFEQKIRSARLTDPSDHHIFLDEKPRPVLRMIQALYTGEYFGKEPASGSQWEEILEKSRTPVEEDEAEAEAEGGDGNANDDNVSMVDSFYSEYSPKYLFLHADMYALAERYRIPSVTRLAVRNFLAETSAAAFDVDKLLWTLEYLYVTGPHTDGEDLRRRAVFLAQRCEMRMHVEPVFKKLMRTCPAFAWDYATRFARGAYLMCFCCEVTRLPLESFPDGDDDDDGDRKGEIERSQIQISNANQIQTHNQGPSQIAHENGSRREQRARECLCGFTHACGNDDKCRVGKGGLCEKCRVGRMETWDIDCVQNSDIMSVVEMMEMFHPTGREMPR